MFQCVYIEYIESEIKNKYKMGIVGGSLWSEINLFK